ncbi:MAG: PAS domain S-box protein [Desulfobulbaceae bacterium]|nr:PAS domain S-box protein [Desulfobulbaceae bacterium]
MKRHIALQKALPLVAEKAHHFEKSNKSIHRALGILGESADLSRVYVIMHHANLPGHVLSEWTASKIAPLSNISKRNGFPYKGKRYVYWKKALEDGRPVYILSSILSISPRQVPSLEEIESIVLFPIKIGNTPWGVIGFEGIWNKSNCSEKIIEDLKIATNILAGAIRSKNIEKILRQSRSRYRNVIDKQVDVVCRYNADWTLTFANNAFCTCLGLKRQDILGQDIRNFVPVTFQERIKECTSLINQECPALTKEHNLELPNEEKHWFQWIDNGIFSHSGTILEYQSTGRDINQQKIKELELEKKRKIINQKLEDCTEKLAQTCDQLVRSEKMALLGLLVASIAHEINNPNNFISFNVPILRDYVQKITTILTNESVKFHDYDLFGMSFPEFLKDLSEIINNIDHGSSRINSIVSRLKEFARPKSNEDILPVNIRPVIEQATEICRRQVMEKVKSLEVNIPSNLPMIVTSPQILEEIIINLINNAAQAADKENSWIKINVELGKTDRDYFILEIKDNGSGFSSKVRREIFKPFYTTKEKELGTGLGLYISKNLIESIGGRLEVKSKLYEGSTFRVVVPRLLQNLQ